MEVTKLVPDRRWLVNYFENSSFFSSAEKPVSFSIYRKSAGFAESINSKEFVDLFESRLYLSHHEKMKYRTTRSPACIFRSQVNLPTGSFDCSLYSSKLKYVVFNKFHLSFPYKNKDVLDYLDAYKPFIEQLKDGMVDDVRLHGISVCRFCYGFLAAFCVLELKSYPLFEDEHNDNNFLSGFYNIISSFNNDIFLEREFASFLDVDSKVKKDKKIHRSMLEWVKNILHETPTRTDLIEFCRNYSKQRLCENEDEYTSVLRAVGADENVIARLQRR